MFMYRVSTRASEIEIIGQKMPDRLSELQAALVTEAKCLVLSQKSLLSDKLKEADALRDDYYRAFKKAVKGSEGIPVPAIQEAAIILSQLIKDYRIDPKMQLDKETGLLMNLLDDLSGRFKQRCQTRSLGLDLRLFLWTIVDDAVDHPVIIFHGHLCIFQVIVRKKRRKLNKAHAVHIMRAYRTLLPQHNNVADGQAVPGKILRMGGVEFHVQVVQTSFCTAVRRERTGIDRLVMVICRLKPMLPEILRIHKAKLSQFRISAELINAVAVCRILLEGFLPSVFCDDEKLLLYSLPVCAVNPHRRWDRWSARRRM